MWTQCGRDDPKTGIKEGDWPRSPNKHKGFRRGRYWVRTSDLCRVKAALFR